MLNEADLMVDRRRLRRRLTAWRVVAVIAIIGAIVALLAGTGGLDDLRKRENHIARIRISGVITGDQDTLDVLKDIGKSSAAKALIVRIDSPGGTTVGSEAVYNELREIAKKRPVVAVMDTIAASGGYITAIAADHIIAHGNTITGSIGVIFQWPDVSKLMDTLGVRMEEIKSGELKAEPSPFKPMSEKVREVSTIMVQDSFAWFVGLVADRRPIPIDRVRVLADGRVYTGRQAVAEKLIDELGEEDTAVAWLKRERKIASDLEVIEWKPKDSGGATGLGVEAARAVLGALGLDWLTSQARVRQLDGLLALWHPAVQ